MTYPTNYIVSSADRVVKRFCTTLKICNLGDACLVQRIQLGVSGIFLELVIARLVAKVIANINCYLPVLKLHH